MTTDAEKAFRDRFGITPEDTAAARKLEHDLRALVEGFVRDRIAGDLMPLEDMTDEQRARAHRHSAGIFMTASRAASFITAGITGAAFLKCGYEKNEVKEVAHIAARTFEREIIESYRANARAVEEFLSKMAPGGSKQ